MQVRRQAAWLATVFAAPCLASAELSGQGTGQAAGVVRDDAGRPIAGAVVWVPAVGQQSRTDSAGRFVLRGLGLGDQIVRARRLRYDPAETTVHVPEGAPREVVLVLTPRSVLDTVAVLGECPARNFAGFACRRRMGAGVFLDETAIDSLDAGHRGTGDLFREQEGFRVLASPSGVRFPVATGGGKCIAQLVNGLPASAVNPMPRYLSDVIGAEIYERADDVPKPYQRYVWNYDARLRQNVPCAVAVYWTSRRK
jgi:hypothetical protein